MKPSLVVVHGVGDSLTAAISDVWTNGKLTPWHEILVELIRVMGIDVVLTSRYARTGASSAEVRDQQLSRAVIAPGDLVCMWIGGNDILRSGYTLADTSDGVSGAFDKVRDAGGIPLTMELPVISSALPGPAWAMRSWDRQGLLVNELVAARSPSCGGLHLPWPGPHVTGPDGTHLSQLGHYYYAEEYAVALAARWGLAAPAVIPPPGLPTFTERERWRWYLANGARWLVRRRFDKRKERRSRGQIA